MLRNSWLIGTCVAIGLIVWCSPSAPVSAGGKKDDLNKANQHIQQLQKSLKERDNKITQLQQHVTALEADLKKKKGKTTAQLQKELDKANQALKDKDQQIRDLELIKNAPYVHATVFQMRKDVDDEQARIITETAAKTLAQIKGVRALWIGAPVKNSPAEPAKDYQLGLVVLMSDADTLQKFHADPLYRQFYDRVMDYWQRPQPRDFRK